MGKVIFTISYDVIPEQRDEYLALTREMKTHLVEKNAKNYSVYEQKGKKNSFSEVFVCSSREEYDQLEDQDEQMSQYIDRLESLLADGKMKYTTLVEVE
ncbi:MAG: hypothetical protein HY033_11605 [Ignavibacteriae bacterium]|nr:hypothetical protein [Ignavibacteriota bacterium]